MDDVVLMAVVDALQNLLHQHRRVALAEFTPLQNFVKELTALADPTRIKSRINVE